MFKIKAMIHSLKSQDEVIILHENGCNDVVVEYMDKRYTAVYNGFVGLFYVDDIYGELKDTHKCPICEAYIQ